MCYNTVFCIFISTAGLLQFAVHYYHKALEFPLHEVSLGDGQTAAKVRVLCSYQVLNFLAVCVGENF